MYGKIFDTIYDGTLAEDWRALITFQQFIVLCDADGIVDMTPQSITRRTGIPIEHIKAGIEILEKTDKYSRTPDQGGKRIERLDAHRPWGWSIVNHEKYKHLQDSDTVRAQNRERKQRQREKEKSRLVTVGHGCVTQGHTESRYTDTDTDTNTKIKIKAKQDRFAPPSIQEVIKYCTERKNNVDPQKFVDHYEANGWMRGKNKIKCWKACVRTWEGNEKPKQKATTETWI